MIAVISLSILHVTFFFFFLILFCLYLRSGNYFVSANIRFNKVDTTGGNIYMKVATIPGLAWSNQRVTALLSGMGPGNQPNSLSLSGVFYIKAFTSIGVQYAVYLDSLFESDAESSLSVVFLGKSCHGSFCACPTFILAKDISVILILVSNADCRAL